MSDETQTKAESDAERQAREVREAKVAAEAKQLAEDLDFLGSPVSLDSPELAAVSAPVRTRNERQAKMDEIGKRLFEHWQKIGSPSVWTKMVTARATVTYFSPPEKSADLKKLINRIPGGITTADVRIKWGTSWLVTPALAQRHKLPENYVGREAISFGVIAKRPRTSKSGPKENAATESASTAPSTVPVTEKQDSGKVEQTKQNRRTIAGIVGR